MSTDKDKSKVHKLNLKGMVLILWDSMFSDLLGSAKLVAEFVRGLDALRYNVWGLTIAVSILNQYNSVRTVISDFTDVVADCESSFQRGVYPAEDFTA